MSQEALRCRPWFFISSFSMSNQEPNRFIQHSRDSTGRMSSGGKGAGSGSKSSLGAGALAYGIKEATYTVEGGQRAIIFNRIGGMQMDTISAEGLHFRIPWFQYPIIYDIRAKPRKISSSTGSKDSQMVNIGVRVLSRPMASNLPAMYQRSGKDYDERVSPSIVNEVLKSVVAKFNASQLITQRAQVSSLVRRESVERAKDFNIILDDVSITELSFSSQYTAAVEAKQVAQQEAQRAQFYVEKAKQDQRQKIIQAEGEAEAAKMLPTHSSSKKDYRSLAEEADCILLATMSFTVQAVAPTAPAASAESPPCPQKSTGPSVVARIAAKRRRVSDFCTSASAISSLAPEPGAASRLAP